jgi:hypothetical protein
MPVLPATGRCPRRRDYQTAVNSAFSSGRAPVFSYLEKTLGLGGIFPRYEANTTESGSSAPTLAPPVQCDAVLSTWGPWGHSPSSSDARWLELENPVGRNTGASVITQSMQNIQMPYLSCRQAYPPCPPKRVPIKGPSGRSWQRQARKLLAVDLAYAGIEGYAGTR